MKKAATSKQYRRNRINNVENDVSMLKDTFTIFCAMSVNMFPVCAQGDQKKMLHGLGGIGDLNTNAECIIESESKIAVLGNKLTISDRTASPTLLTVGLLI